jgi:uncharacterized membrane protein YcaP (DUF421 family)
MIGGCCMSIVETMIRTLFGFTMMLVYIKILGKKQFGELTFFNYVTGVSLGNIAGDMVVHKDIKPLDGFIGITLWALLTFTLGYISLKSSKAKKLINGEPAIVIKNGVVFHDILASHRINMDDLSMLLRTNSIFSIKDVDYAIIEPNGQLSVLKKIEKDVVTKGDMKIQTQVRKYLPTEIIVDGAILERNLKEQNLDSTWLGKQLAQSKVSTVADIFFAQLQEDGSLYIIKK